ncbi:uncharacterized protein SPPG_05224 [Spizellomyces punctatus DAOM BR117]|uniref:DUF3752 domain-containing protein n=1 Tax=Spizellomyces punctatus (strain DAOM BR117) TaxID=645134 RepID=A0A0L0HEF7_SPIPD|nr:uncharacterized protein SPPG_05224 [Spizellomyces punctatus DAOM BR117]KNC99850.1 hypothetical protein SPPG_05224 [Spizellomyces punctatus DAOM BR117]|eukprot:XP_016607890.1 hypothetical protein SPPG_05224 [Spizellomyces punctatus DAOM BR117]
MYGPQLPPSRRESSPEEADIGPKSPPSPSPSPEIGPSRPHITATPPEQEATANDGTNSSSEEDTFGPSLPPRLLAARQKQRQGASPPARRKLVAGPAAPPPPGFLQHAEVDSDDEVGPKPAPRNGEDELDDLQSRIAEFEERERRAKEEAENASRPEKIVRGDWMLVPPEANRLPIAMGSMKSRQFSKSSTEKDIDQSGWTETPQDREKNAGQKRKRPPKDEPRPPTEEELRTREFVKRHTEKHRGKALMDQHMSTYIRNGRLDEEDVSKRKFDREQDMGGSRRIDAKSRQEMLDQARKLDSKFGHGRKTFL